LQPRVDLAKERRRRISRRASTVVTVKQHEYLILNDVDDATTVYVLAVVAVVGDVVGATWDCTLREKDTGRSQT
jgi:hypothetical protein